MTMTNFGLDTYNIYSDRQVVPNFYNEERIFEGERIDIKKVVRKTVQKTSVFTKLISIFL